MRKWRWNKKGVVKVLFTPLRMGQLTNNTTKYPTLKAKAAVAKHMVGFCIVLAHRQAGHGNRRAYTLKPAHRLHAYTEEYGKLVVTMFEGVQNYYRACDATPLQREACIDSMYAFLSSLEQLNTLWCTGLATDELRQKMPFHVRPKIHMIQHLVEDQKKGSRPRECDCGCEGFHTLQDVNSVFSWSMG